MSLTGLLDAVVRDPALAEAVGAAADGHRPHVDLVGPPAARPFAYIPKNYNNIQNNTV